MKYLALWLCGGCVPLVADVPSNVDGGGELIMTTVSDDYAVGSLSTVSTADWSVSSDLASTHSDAVVSWSGGALWVINRLRMDTVRRYTAGTWSRPMWEVSTGEGSNPHDVAVCDDKAVVSLYAEDHLLVLNAEDGAVIGRVDLSDEADEDGLPEASGLVVIGGRLFVGVQRMRRDLGWQPSEHGLVLELDCGSLEIVDRWLVGPNPVLVADEAVGTLLALTEWGVEQVVLEEPGETVLRVASPGGGVWSDGGIAGDMGMLISRVGSEHTLACLDLIDWSIVPMDRVANYLPSVVVTDAGEAWIAARRGWEDPTEAGGLLVVDTVACTSLTQDDWVRPNLAPFSLVLARATEDP
jgi:hypothetical protein